MFPIMLLYQIFFFVFLTYLFYYVYYYWILKRTDIEGLETQDSGSGSESGIPGKELIDEKVVYKVISSERQDNEQNYADIPDNGQAVQFMTDGEDGNMYIVNPITGKPFYINNNHVTIKIHSIRTNKFPEYSLLVNAVAKCKNCKSITNWEMFVLPVQNIDATVDVVDEK